MSDNATVLSMTKTESRRLKVLSYRVDQDSKDVAMHALQFSRPATTECDLRAIAVIIL